ncbi:hypothetical protein J2TS6_48090 [Paenibacillus albilobatus]|uniref:Uncharacterized protein n=1 Tax=Paenibacillus albilobatus TaxID=2716884 RepID=A0A919XLL2_9BACL|nr:hypothetical protein J2TS6_48090 [Paenibacillus albilobatus]
MLSSSQSDIIFVIPRLGQIVCFNEPAMIPELQIGHVALNDIPVQLGSIQEPYGFDGILGIDFMIKAKCKANFEALEITFN